MFSNIGILILGALLTALLAVSQSRLDPLVSEIFRDFRFASRSLHLLAYNFSRTSFALGVLWLVPCLLQLGQDNLTFIAEITAACFLALGLAFALKYVLLRPRPFGHITYIGKVDSAFPSSHTAGSFAAAFVWLDWFGWGWGSAALVFASLVAFSRIYRGLHHLSDIWGGVALAYGFVIFVQRTDFLAWLMNH